MHFYEKHQLGGRFEVDQRQSLLIELWRMSDNTNNYENDQWPMTPVSRWSGLFRTGRVAVKVPNEDAPRWRFNGYIGADDGSGGGGGDGGDGGVGGIALFASHVA